MLADAAGTPIALPQNNSIEHAALGSALQSNGTPGGYFAGVIDEARVWNVVRTPSEIQANMGKAITSATGLLGRWGLNEGSGTTAGDSAGSAINGTLTNGPLWVTGSSGLGNHAPTVAPAIDQAAPKTNDVLSVTPNGTDADGDPLTYTYQWRKGGVDIGGATGPSAEPFHCRQRRQGRPDLRERSRPRRLHVFRTLVAAPVTILNTAPVVDSVAITVNNPGPTDTLFFTASQHDDDLDATTVSRQWAKNGTDLPGKTGGTLDLARSAFRTATRSPCD